MATRKANPPVPWVPSFGTGKSAPSGGVPASAVREDQWVRILPTAFGSLDLVSVEPFDGENKLPFKQPPSKRAVSLDRKLVLPRPFFARGSNLFCSEEILHLLERVGATGWAR